MDVDPGAEIAREVGEIEALAERAVVYTFSAGPGYSLEGSRGEIFALPAMTPRKVVIAFFGESYRAELRLYARDSSLLSAELHWKDYQIDETRGVIDPPDGKIDVARVYFRGTEIVAARDGNGAELEPWARDRVLEYGPPLWTDLLACFDEPETWPTAFCRIDPTFDPQLVADDPRIVAIDRERARLQAEPGGYQVSDFSWPNWQLTGSISIGAGDRLRKLELEKITDAGERERCEYDYRDGTPFFIACDRTPGSAALEQEWTSFRTYLDAGHPIRIVDGTGKRIRIDSHTERSFGADRHEASYFVRCYDRTTPQQRVKDGCIPSTPRQTTKP